MSYISEPMVFGNTVEFQQGVAREYLQQENLARYPLHPETWKVHDTLAALTSAGNDDLGIDGLTHGTDVTHLTSGDGAQTTISRKARRSFMLPPEYVAGQTVRITVSAIMETISDDTATLDISVFKSGGNAAVSGSDLYSGSAVDINSASAAEVTFDLTSANLSPGDRLDIMITVAITDAATGSGVVANLEPFMDLDIRG